MPGCYVRHVARPYRPNTRFLQCGLAAQARLCMPDGTVTADTGNVRCCAGCVAGEAERRDLGMYGGVPEFGAEYRRVIALGVGRRCQHPASADQDAADLPLSINGRGDAPGALQPASIFAFDGEDVGVGVHLVNGEQAVVHAAHGAACRDDGMRRIVV
jgi:hypothetical protein